MPDTKILGTSIQDITEGANIIRRGGLVAFGTETVYGLGANAFDHEAVAAIYKAKGRPSDNPLIVHIHDRSTIKDLARDIPVAAVMLIKKFWPGPLTLVLNRKSIVPDIVTGGLDTVAVRMPDSAVALDLIKQCGVPLCAPSANRSGRPSPTAAAHVLEDLDGMIDAVIDSGACNVGVESTVVDLTSDIPRILRSGGISKEELESVLGILDETEHTGKALAPGMKYRHYAPSCKMVYIPYSSNMVATANEEYDKNPNAVIVCLSSLADSFGNRVVLCIGDTPKEYARNLFKTLRESEKTFDTIIALGIEEVGIGVSVANRLKKASGIDDVL